MQAAREDLGVQEARVREVEVLQQPARPPLVHVAAVVALVHADALPHDGFADRGRVQANSSLAPTGEEGDAGACGGVVSHGVVVFRGSRVVSAESLLGG